jgi:hypothetical protein
MTISALCLSLLAASLSNIIPFAQVFWNKFNPLLKFISMCLQNGFLIDAESPRTKY